MDYRIEHRERQRFLALVRAFSNESNNDDNGHSIPDFWTECWDKNLIDPMKLFRKQVIRRQKILTMRYILKRVKAVCSASYGFLS